MIASQQLLDRENKIQLQVIVYQFIFHYAFKFTYTDRLKNNLQSTTKSH